MDMTVPQEILQVQEPLPRFRDSDRFAFHFSPQLMAQLDTASACMWLRWNPAPRPCFNPALLASLREYCDFLSASGGCIRDGEETSGIEYAVLSSRVPGIFNLGGDLDLFTRLIETRDHQELLRYGLSCVDVLYRNYIGHGVPQLTTISLVQGDCMGGGFECALSSDVLIAEKSARFGFPEILFNLFPGMGAYSFLQRRVGQKTTEDLITSGKIYSAHDMLALGVIDIVVDDDQGEAEVAALIKRRGRSRNALSAIAETRRRAQPLEYKELADIVDIWVAAAFRLSARDVKLMQRLVHRQNTVSAGEGVSLH
ncbi:MAG TPA: crotonase/enoyl-CoA hydratase family protein [Burkholderiales bacterium]|nr:crotonase/enoyl-CoA hydratase family protein [Burkholderiales bacterium]